MEKVEQIIEISSKLETIQQFCEFVEDVHKITKCQKSDYPIDIYSAELGKKVFDSMVDYDVCTNVSFKFWFESSKAFWAMFQLQKRVKKCKMVCWFIWSIK